MGELHKEQHRLFWIKELTNGFNSIDKNIKTLESPEIHYWTNINDSSMLGDVSKIIVMSWGFGLFIM